MKDVGRALELKTLPGLDIVLLGYVGLEESLRILNEREEELSERFTSLFIRQAKALKRYLSTDDAWKAAEGFDIRYVRRIVGGGIFDALWNLGEDCRFGFETDLSRMLLRQETVEICEYYGLNPYRMPSAGSFLIVAREGESLTRAFKAAGAPAAVLGRSTADRAKTVKSKAGIRYLDRPSSDGSTLCPAKIPAEERQ